MRIDKKEEIVVKKDDNLKVIHHVHILDSSGSMAGAKYNNATKGIDEEISELIKQAENFPNVKNTITIVEFSGYDQIKTHCFIEPVEKYKPIRWKIMNDMTALYDTLGSTIEKLLKGKADNDKVLLKVFTDGGENGSRGKYLDKSLLARLIKKVQDKNNFTITFVGTEFDVTSIIKNLNIDASNTLVHENTGESVKMSFSETLGSTINFMSAVEDGLNVSRGFYSKTINDGNQS